MCPPGASHSLPRPSRECHRLGYKARCTCGQDVAGAVSSIVPLLLTHVLLNHALLTASPHLRQSCPMASDRVTRVATPNVGCYNARDFTVRSARKEARRRSTRAEN